MHTAADDVPSPLRQYNPCPCEEFICRRRLFAYWQPLSHQIEIPGAARTKVDIANEIVMSLSNFNA